MSKSFYIQVRGKKQGPFTVERLRHMARQGRFGRQHRVSTNGKKWKSAEEFPELFNAEGERKLRHAGGGNAEAAAPPGSAAAAPGGTDSQGWFYSHDGQQFGPSSFEVIRHAHQTGTLTADDLVWTAGMTEWKKADKAFPGLFNGTDTSSAAAEPAGDNGPGGTPSEGPVKLHNPMCSMAIYSLVLSLVPVIGSIPAIICGHKALNEIENSDRPMDGRALALAGLALGYAVVGAGVLYGLFAVSSTMFSGQPSGSWSPELMAPDAATPVAPQ